MVWDIFELKTQIKIKVYEKRFKYYAIRFMKKGL